MKLIVTSVILLAFAIGLWYFSGIMFVFTLGLLIGTVGGTINGFYLNDWYETTWHYKWCKRRREAKAIKLAKRITPPVA